MKYISVAWLVLVALGFLFFIWNVGGWQDLAITAGVLIFVPATFFAVLDVAASD